MNLILKFMGVYLFHRYCLWLCCLNKVLFLKCCPFKTNRTTPKKAPVKGNGSGFMVTLVTPVASRHLIPAAFFKEAQIRFRHFRCSGRQGISLSISSCPHHSPCGDFNHTIRYRKVCDWREQTVPMASRAAVVSAWHAVPLSARATIYKATVSNEARHTEMRANEVCNEYDSGLCLVCCVAWEGHCCLFLDKKKKK